MGIVQFDGSAVEPGLLRALTAFLTFRGPDGRHTWIKDSVGFGHTLFTTTEESDRDCQPLTLDGNSWIVADARIDARGELLAELRGSGEADHAQTRAPSSWTDAELILRAYCRWGTACVERLRGDFAFGIWDDVRHELFCARDHLGVKPFYYVRIASRVIFSNTLDCLRRHPGVSDKLNDLAIADFLLFGFNQDAATSSFAQIQRLPPAHCAIWSQNNLQLTRYWSLPIDEPLLYKRADDYLDRFRDLLRTAVADRLRTNQVWIFMSGGLDSPTLAATARDLRQNHDASFDLRAVTVVDSLACDESRYARAVAAHLKIPIYFRQPADPVENWEQIPFFTPEPRPDAWSVPAERRFWKELGTYSRVFFFGEGPDNALQFDWRPYIAYLIRHNLYGRLVAESASTLFSQRYPPFWLRICNGFRPREAEAIFPPWLEPTLESRLQLRERWRTLNSAPVAAHPIRPAGYSSFQTPLWQALFENFDTAINHARFEVRHPYLDLQMLRFLLAVPALPWCRSKHLIRRAMRGELPGEILRRRKTGTASAPMRKKMAGLCTLPFLPARGLCEYVDSKRIQSPMTANLIESNLRARSLNHWLQNSLPANHNHEQEIFCDEAVRQNAPRR